MCLCTHTVKPVYYEQFGTWVYFLGPLRNPDMIYIWPICDSHAENLLKQSNCKMTWKILIWNSTIDFSGYRTGSMNKLLENEISGLRMLQNSLRSWGSRLATIIQCIRKTQSSLAYQMPVLFLKTCDLLKCGSHPDNLVSGWDPSKWPKRRRLTPNWLLTPLGINHKCPNYHGVLISQVSLHDKVPFGTITKCVSYTDVFIFKHPD